MAKAFPLLDISGQPYEMGFEHGRQASEQVEHNLSVYFRRFKEQLGLPRQEVLERAKAYLDLVKRNSKDYAEAMAGVADGSGCDLLEVAALNVRYEIIYSEFRRIGLKIRRGPHGCTALALMPDLTVDGHLLMAQNWDWIPDIEGLFLRIRGEGGFKILCFTEAGVVGGKVGFNSAGVGLAINGLVSHADDWRWLRKPFHVRCWEILNSRSLEEASSIVVGEPHSCSANFLLGQVIDNQYAALDLEASPNGVVKLAPEGGLLIHTNHFISPGIFGIHEPLDIDGKNSLRRYENAKRLLIKYIERRKKVDVGLLQDLLRNHDGYPDSICCHPSESSREDERYKTVVSIVMDLHSKRMWAARGLPCQSDYVVLNI